MRAPSLAIVRIKSHSNEHRSDSDKTGKDTFPVRAPKSTPAFRGGQPPSGSPVLRQYPKASRPIAAACFRGAQRIIANSRNSFLVRGWGGGVGLGGVPGRSKGAPLFRTARWKHPGAIETHGHLLHFNNGFPSPNSAARPPRSPQPPASPTHRLPTLLSAYVQHGGERERGSPDGCSTAHSRFTRELYGTRRAEVTNS